MKRVTGCLTPPSFVPLQTPSRYVSRVPASPNHRVQEYSSYSSTSTSSSSANGGRPVTESRTTERKYESGPYGVNYCTERSSTTGNGPAGYSYSSTTSGRLPGGTYRHFSYRV